MKRTDNGILIAIEGIDGAGKTTQVGLLADFLTTAGETVVRSKEPTDGPWGQKIRRSAANGRMSFEEELEAFIEDRREHVDRVILPALTAGQTVILDRYYYSTIAYQGVRGDAKMVTARVRAAAPEPDAVLLLDVPPEVGLARVNGRGTANVFESARNLRDVRTAFLEMVGHHPNITRIDATPRIEAVRQGILHALLDGLLYRRHCEKHWGCDDPFHCAYRMTGMCRWATMKKLAANLEPAV